MATGVCGGLQDEIIMSVIILYPHTPTQLISDVVCKYVLAKLSNLKFSNYFYSSLLGHVW